MRRTALYASPLILALAACDGGNVVVDDPSDPEQIAAASATLPQPEPGEYTGSMEISEFSMDGVEEEQQALMRAAIEGMSGQERTTCITPEMAEEGYQEFLANLNQGAEGCEFTSFTVEGDTLSADMQCDDDAGTSGTMQLTGTVTSTSQDMTVRMDMTDSAQNQTMRMTMRNQMERTGDCDA